MEEYIDWLETIGLRPFTSEELFDMHKQIVRQIQIGIDRTDQSAWPEDGGLQAIATHTQHVTFEQVQALPNGSAAIVAACGGTNWIFSVARKNADGQIRMEEPIRVVIKEKERSHTFDSLVDLIANYILQAVKRYHLSGYTQLPIAISFGFPQKNVVLENGDIDARILSGVLPKKWRITDASAQLPAHEKDQTSLATVLREKLLQRGMDSIGRIAFSNDTVAVALDVQYALEEGLNAPVGFVFGSGTNTAVMGTPDQGLINLESGYATAIQVDDVFTEMVQCGYVSEDYPVIEHWLGGAYVAYRVAAAAQLLSQKYPSAQQWAAYILKSTDQALISKIASGQLTGELGELCNAQDRGVLQEMGLRALTQAGQLAGVQVAAALSALHITDSQVFVPFEGGVLKYAFGVSDTAQQTIQLLLPEQSVETYTATGMVGIAKLALVDSQ